MAVWTVNKKGCDSKTLIICSWLSKNSWYITWVLPIIRVLRIKGKLCLSNNIVPRTTTKPRSCVMLWFLGKMVITRIISLLQHEHGLLLDCYCPFFRPFGINNDGFTSLLILVWFGCLMIFVFWYHSCLYIMQESSHLRKVAIVSICLRMVLIQIITRVLFTLTYPSNIKIWLVLQFWYPWVGFLIHCGCWLLMPLQSPNIF